MGQQLLSLFVDGNEGGPSSDTQVGTEQINLEEKNEEFIATVAKEHSRSRAAKTDAKRLAKTSAHFLCRISIFQDNLNLKL
ncbi:Hypothetical predicted protein [Olea europaea subsp. europaea]|uniref:Uncharacterized protein n=1 Tax=Olea europaea subsp. europaea TaxID=158383 RepID=A0A8S0R0I5_OLEEU|nr:Hypothetical predicted protein [Olea europaea subsp. europaea]